MPATDDMAARVQEKIDRANAFIEEIASGARKDDRDLTDAEHSLLSNARGELEELNKQQRQLAETLRIVRTSRETTAMLSAETARDRRYPSDDRVGRVEYRSAGHYIADRYQAMLGSEEANERLEVFHRVAAHQTTADNAGLLPESIAEPVLNRVDNARPIVSAIGTRDLGPGSWAYARVTQHTQVAAQSAEKAELASRKMLITKTSITAPTLGGYVNVSKQDINRTSPQILDMVIDDLASEYAIETEEASATVLVAGATAGTGTALPATPTAAQVNTLIWSGAAQAYTTMRGQGRLILAIAPNMLGLVGPLFAPVNPQSAFSSGFEAGSFGSGAMGAISGITVVMSPALASGTMLVINTEAVRIFEMRYGALQVAEPSVWGVQVGYAGDFQTVILDAGGVIALDTTP